MVTVRNNSDAPVMVGHKILWPTETRRIPAKMVEGLEGLTVLDSQPKDTASVEQPLAEKEIPEDGNNTDLPTKSSGKRQRSRRKSGGSGLQ